jgi:hypothetical protein
VGVAYYTIIGEKRSLVERLVQWILSIDKRGLLPRTVRHVANLLLQKRLDMDQEVHLVNAGFKTLYDDIKLYRHNIVTNTTTNEQHLKMPL